MKAILWDFDGTLAYRPDRWSGALLDVLDEQEPGHQLTKADLRSGLQDGFPWHRPERPHHELSKPGAWWALVEGILAETFVGAGFEPARAQTLARVRAAIARLPRLQREVIRLRLDAELPFKTIAEVLGTSESSAKVSHHHAIRALRDRLSKP